MPLFRRNDGVLLRDLPLVRRIMPYLMKSRTESVVHIATRWDLEKTHGWLERWRERTGQKATLFHLVLYACARALHERPGMNRFVSGGRIYERKGVFISFAAKMAFEDKAPFLTVKLEFPKEESFGELVERMTKMVAEGRGGKKQQTDTELKLVFKLPGVVIRFLVGVVRFLDAVNLLPRFWTAPDPMYTSLFLANLGSVGLDAAYHHLYEYGTCSIFGAMGLAQKSLVVGADGKPEAREGVVVNWTFDERINDGFYGARSFDIARGIVEDPERFIALPEDRAATSP